MINRKNRTTMKLRKYLAVLAVAAFASLATSCAEAEDEFIHTDSTINSIEIQPAGAGIAGIIDETTGEIFFPIPKQLREKYDVKKLMVRANVAYDTYIYPSLSGLKDLSDPMEIKVRAGDNGSRTYTLWAFYTRR